MFSSVETMATETFDDLMRFGQTSRSIFTPTASSLIVEVEGFQMKKDFFVKELAFVNPITQHYWVGTFEPPHGRQYMKKKYQQDMDWTTIHLHGLTWEDGCYPYSVAFYMLHHFGANHQLFAKGKQKCHWIKQHTGLSVLDLEDIGCPAAKDLPFGSVCEYHDSRQKACALDKATRLGTYIVDMFAMKNL